MRAKDIRICFIGDSFVNGTGDTEALGWTGRVCQIINSRGTKVTYYNLGVRRDTSAGVRTRWLKEAAPRLKGNFDGRVVFSFGVNDTLREGKKQRLSPAASVKNLRAILSAAKKKYPVIMIGPPPVDDEAHNRRLELLSAAFADVCAKLEVPYLDIYTPLRRSDFWMEEVALHDGAHPDGGGYTLLAALVLEWHGWWFR